MIQLIDRASAHPRQDIDLDPTERAELDLLIDQLIDVGVLNPVVSAAEYLDARAPYDYHVSFKSYEEISGQRYIYLLRRLAKSVNLALKRRAGFRAFSDSCGVQGLQLINGFIVMQCHQARPSVDILCNAHPYSGLEASDIEDAFLSTKCYVSRHNRAPLFDVRTLKVSRSIDEFRIDALADDDPYLLSMNGGLLKWDN